MNKRNHHYHIKNIKLKKVLFISFLLSVVQLLLVLTIIIYSLIYKNNDMYNLIYISAALTAFNGILTAFGYYFILYTKNSSILETLKQVEELNGKLREQRHDYLNHIQVIYGLLELEEFEEAKNYMEPVYKDILKLSKALRTAHPAVNALLQAKMQMAEKYEVDVYLEVKTDLSKINIEPWELCKVLANIIDNAIRALTEKEKNRVLNIDIGEDLYTYMIYIYNNGPQIPEGLLEHIFEESVTTKQEEGHGIGLCIAKHIIEKANGTVQVSSKHDKTCFYITIPKV